MTLFIYLPYAPLLTCLTFSMVELGIITRYNHLTILTFFKKN